MCTPEYTPPHRHTSIHVSHDLETKQVQRSILSVTSSLSLAAVCPKTSVLSVRLRLSIQFPGEGGLCGALLNPGTPRGGQRSGATDLRKSVPDSFATFMHPDPKLDPQEKVSLGGSYD